MSLELSELFQICTR